MRRILAVLLLGAIVGAGLACRELASPVADLETLHSVHGSVHRADGVAVLGTRLEFRPFSPVFTGRYHEVVFADEEGRFALEVPDIPLTVEVLPPRGLGAAPLRLEGVRLEAGAELDLVLPGFRVRGHLVDPSLYPPTGSRIVFLRIPVSSELVPTGEIYDSAPLEVDGSFVAFAHTEGEYSVDFQQRSSTGDSWLHVADGLALAEGDSLELTLPLVPVEITLYLRGEPVIADPAARVLSEIRNPQGERDWYAVRWCRPLGVNLYRAWLAEGTNQFLWIPGSYGILNWVQNFFTVPPIEGGEAFALDLARYELLLRAEDAGGGALQESVSFTFSPSNRPGLGGVHGPLEPDGSYTLRLNEGSYTFRIPQGLYAGNEQILVVEGDGERLLILEPQP